MKRVAVIGAGAAGLAAIKALKEEGIDYVCYEMSGRVAGLWNYREDDIDGQACVMKTTVINSSKEMSAFSDFPPPADFPNYMHNRKMCKYFHMYAEKFGLLDKIRYYQEGVFNVDKETGLTLIEIADGVTLEEIINTTACQFEVSPDLKPMGQV